ncbi:MAG: BON domain-containing protein [Phycisphaerales bacterium]|nr:BON domain-containing protein [Planctomycetota bacterium]MCH8507820.1 BON domain-containing protein [Phycisphaerales bacterium]
MKNMMTRTALIAASTAFGMTGCDSRDSSSAARTSQPAQERSTSTAPADNTGSNRGDTGRDAMTPMNQSQTSEHVSLTADIRRAIISDDTLSAGAKNCKIITDSSGMVWLRGAVKSNGEKNLIGRIARQIAGENAVTNELEITGG